ncbi:golgin subfamily A member 6-like protein 22 [Palaemon carinicauda]|uniref:golgin subfamily A member 6-like protein 22 n=1 Tax=Palaemon carinicauda TaxID=392227 RepID=UPI0035B5F9F5
MESKLKALDEELWHYKEREQKLIVEKEWLLVENERLNYENEAMQKELRELKGTVERVEECFEMRMKENEERMEERMEAMMGKVMVMIKTFMGEGAVGGVSSASGNGLIVEEKAKLGYGSGECLGRMLILILTAATGKLKALDEELRHYKEREQKLIVEKEWLLKCDRRNEKKGKSDVKKEKKKCQDESNDNREWVKVVSKKRARKSMIKDKSMSVELDSLYSSEEVGNKREGCTDDISKLKALDEELRHYKEREQKLIVEKEWLLVENERLNCEKEAMLKELREYREWKNVLR